MRFEIRPSGAGAYSAFGTQTLPVRRLDLPADAGDGAFADGPADLRVVAADLAGNETTSAARTVMIDTTRPSSCSAIGRSHRSEREPERDLVGRHDRRHLRCRPVGDPGAGTAIGSDANAPFGATWTTALAAEQQWG